MNINELKKKMEEIILEVYEESNRKPGLTEIMGLSKIIQRTLDYVEQVKE